MQTLLLDFVPVVLFFVAFKFYGIYVATTVGIVLTALQVVLTRWLRKRFDKQQLITLAVFVVFGGMTLYFHNPIFVKWKPTIVFWIFSLVLLGTQFIGKKPLVQRMLEPMLESQQGNVPNTVWKKLNAAWGLFFATLGGVNLYVAYNFSTDAWVNFKLYGVMSFLILFSVGQTLFLSRYLTVRK